MRITAKTTFIIMVFVLTSGCAIMGSKPAKDKRAIVMDMKEKVLQELYKSRPDTRALIAKSAGYGVFANANVKVVIASFGGGYGVIKNNKTGHSTYMRVGELGAGVGLGIKDFRAVIIFHNQKTLHQFVNHGWNFGGHVDAAAKAGNKGTRYWKDTELN